LTPGQTPAGPLPNCSAAALVSSSIFQHEKRRPEAPARNCTRADNYYFLVAALRETPKQPKKALLRVCREKRRSLPAYPHALHFLLRRLKKTGRRLMPKTSYRIMKGHLLCLEFINNHMFYSIVFP
jgi:hypothetical protein